MPHDIRRRAVPSLTVLALCALSACPAWGQGEAESLSASFRKAARRVLPAVVTVRSGGPAAVFPMGRDSPLGPGPRGFGPQLPPGEAEGSGVVIDAEKGYVLTNDHVVQGGSGVVVVLHDGRERSASQVRRDPKSDLALLVVDGKGLTGADWGNSDALDTGDWVLAIGQPFGLSGTVTAGIVGGKGRGIGVAMYEDLIQTDAAINPGSSGGPLIDLKGQVVGINTAIGTLRGGYEGVGFAIPAGRARRIAADLAEHGKVRRAYLGVQIGPVDRATADRLDQPGAVVVNGVTPDSPASEAGLRRGDVITRLDGKPLAGLGALQAAIEFAPVDRPLTLAIERDGERREVQAVPKLQPESFGLREPEPLPRPGPGPRPFLRGLPPGAPEPPGRPGERPGPDGDAPRETQFRGADVRFPELGLRLSEAAPQIARRFRLEGPVHGLTIVGVEPGGPADRGGLEVGMILTHVGDRPLESLDDVRAALAGRREGRDPLVVRIRKGSKAEFRVIPRADDDRAPNEAGRRPGAEPDPSSR